MTAPTAQPDPRRVCTFTHVTGFRFTYNSDYSGDIKIISPDDTCFTLPYEVVRDFVAEEVRRQMIHRTEGAEILLGLAEPFRTSPRVAWFVPFRKVRSAKDQPNPVP